MSHAGWEFHSPLSLLRQWCDDLDAPLREVLITGYTLDLVFLERQGISTARALGARVTVLSDAAQATHDPVDVRHAGRAYQHGHAHCRGAFHPKLVLLLGEEDLWVAIGSGNPTLSGWGHNHELWLVLRTTRGQSPAAVGELADWLLDLPAVVALPSWIAETITTIGHTITPNQVDDSLPDLQIAGNLRRSLLTQLPTGPVDTLRLSAPFFDPDAAAVGALVQRLRPGEMAIAVQPRLSQFSGPALVAATSTVPRVEFRFVAEDRTRHGKLVEWTTGASTTALVGSANLSAAALLTTTAAGGNCELVASYPVAASLLPEGSDTTPDTLAGHNTIPESSSDTSRPALALLGARRLPDTVLVELVTTIPDPVTIETSPDGTPGTWQRVHVLTGHSVRTPVPVCFRAPELLGGAVRAWADTSCLRVTSSPVFLTDTQRCRPRDDTADAPRLARDYPLAEVITDPVLATRFSADLQRLLAEARSRPRVAALRAAGPASPSTPSSDRWGTWLQDVEHTVGPSLTGLLFPGALAGASGAVAEHAVPLGWTVGPEADESELTEGETDEAVDALLAQDANMVTVRLPPVPPAQRRKWRTAARTLTRAIRDQPPPPLELRMLIARVYLDLLAAGIWETDQSWRAELRDILIALTTTPTNGDDVPGQAESFLASLIAVCQALLLQDATLHGGGEHDLIAQTAWTHAHALAAFAEPDLVEGYLYQPEQPYAQVTTQTAVQEVIDLATAAEDDPHAELRAAYDHEGLHVQFMDGVWVADAGCRGPRRLAARVATLAGPHCAVLARNDTGQTTVILRNGSILAIAESTARLWRLYHLSPMGTPATLFSGEDGLPPAARRYPVQPIPEDVRHLTASIGVNPSALVAALHIRI